jgi:hypothetical protein
MTSYCVSITEQTTGKCNLFVKYISQRLARKYKFKTIYKNLMTKKLVHKHRNALKKLW